MQSHAPQMPKRSYPSGGGAYKRRRTGAYRKSSARRNSRRIRTLYRLVRNHVDVKHVDTSISAADVNFTTPTVLKVSAISQGDTDIARDGNRVYFKKLYCDYAVSVPTSANSGSYRIVVIQWLTDDAIGAPTWTSVFTALSIRGLYLANSNNYRVLYDKETAWTWPEVNAHKIFKFFVKPKYHKIKYTDTATTGQNQIYILAISTLAGAGPAIVGNCPLQFTG